MNDDDVYERISLVHQLGYDKGALEAFDCVLDVLTDAVANEDPPSYILSGLAGFITKKHAEHLKKKNQTKETLTKLRDEHYGESK